MQREKNDYCESNSSAHECEVLALGYKYDCGDLVGYIMLNYAKNEQFQGLIFTFSLY